jgi:hypothetical protein
MTLARNTAEGQVNGTNLTSANSGAGSGDAFYLVSPSNTAALTYSTDFAKRGTQSIKVTSTAAGATAFAGLQRTANDSISAAADFMLTGGPTASTCQILGLRNASSPVISVAVATSTNKVTISDGTGQIGISAAAVPFNTWVHVDIRATKGTGTTDGVVAWDIQANGSSVTTGSVTNANAGTAQFTEVRVGKLTSAAAMPIFYMDDVTADDGRTTLIGVAPAAGAATADAGADKTTPVGTGVQLVGAGTGTGITYSWALVSAQGGAAATLTNATTATPTVTPSAAGLLNYRLTVSASGGGTATDDVTVYVPASPAAPLADTANLGVWTQTGAASAYAALADTDASTWTQSPDNPSSPATERVRLAPLPTGTGFTVKIDHRLTAVGTGTATVTLYEGSISRKVWTVTPSTTLATTTLTLTDTELATIGSLNALDLEFSWNV